jgi:DNA-directed RNA polymerase II subunit RPB2
LQTIKHTVETLLLDNGDDLKKLLFQEVVAAASASASASYSDNVINRRYIFTTGKEKENRKAKESMEPLNQIVAAGIRKAFKGAWGADEFTKRDGIVQDLDRLSYNSYLAQLTKTNLTTKGEKMVQPRKLHMSHWGMIDPIDTPDGAHTGLHKHLTIGATVTSGFPAQPIIAWMKNVGQVKLLGACSLTELDLKCKVFVNGRWIGMLDDPPFVKRLLLNYRRVGLLPPSLSIYWDITQKILYLNTDAGRIMRPVYYVDQKYETVDAFRTNNALPKGSKANFSYNVSKNKSFKWDWKSMMKGFANAAATATATATDKVMDAVYEKVYEEEGEEEKGVKEGSIDKQSKQLDGQIKNLLKLYPKRAMLEYLDNSESEGTLIAMSPQIARDNPSQLPYTHIEIHPSLLFSVMSNQVNFLANNPLARDMFSCSQTKQAVSIYHTNFPVRMDKSAHVLHYGQTPLVKSRYLQYINHEENPCGENAIVAIMSYNGFNVEDSILFNEGSIKRGLFNSTAYTTYQGADENALHSDEGKNKGQIYIRNPLEQKAVGMNSKYKYELLNADGLINVNEPIDDKTVLIGRVAIDRSGGDKLFDSSVFPKKGQEGFVDKCYLSEGKEGFRVAKVKIREERIPAVGDKFSSRCGQKGTVGLVIPEADMPFTDRGMRPDIIINPHAFPSRQTVGQLIECVMAKACAIFGGYGDCTAFVNSKENENPAIDFGDLLAHDTGAGSGAGDAYHSSGTEVLYNGSTGEQLEANIYIGPTFYMRLKHMPKDKINYRNEGGPREALTRQPTQGRANDGGLRIGEMDRDALIAHGVSGFLNESMMKRGDEFYLAVCNRTGSIAVYNEAKHLFLSPMIDGPLVYDDVNDKNKMISDVCVQNVNKFPYNFSIVRVPYAFKLLMQELTTMMNVHMRLITSDNVEQMKSLTFSDNINKLGTTLEEMAENKVVADTSAFSAAETDTSAADTDASALDISADASALDISAVLEDTEFLADSETSVAETSVADTSVADSSVAESETSVADTSVAESDTSVADTSVADTSEDAKTFESASLQAANLATPEEGSILAMEKTKDENEEDKKDTKKKKEEEKETKTIQM